MKILITGSAGFIGYHLCKSLLKEGIEIMGVDNISDYYDINLKNDRLDILKSYNNFNYSKVNINNKELLESVFRSFCPEKVVNLAAQPGVSYSLINPDSYISTNLVGFYNMIELSRAHNVSSFVYASSSSVYGDCNELPFNEAVKVDKPLVLYGATKRANELIAYTYSNIYEMHTTGLRYFTVYGPWYRPDMSIAIFANKIVQGQTISLFNNGKIKRDFTYIDDIIDGTKSAMEKNYKYEIFNLGNNKSEKLLKIIHLIEKELGMKAIIENQPPQRGDIIETCADIAASKQKLQYSPKIDVEIGIPLLLDWFKEYYNV